jgi:predicted benzoate:H+ symporter BenE
LPWNILRDQTELIRYEAAGVKCYECVSVFFAFVIQHANRVSSVPHYVTSGLSGCTIFFRFILEATRFSENKLLNIKMVFLYFLQHFFILRRILRYIIINVRRYYCKGPVTLSDFNDTWTFSTVVQRIIKYQILWKFKHWELSCCLRPYRHD